MQSLPENRRLACRIPAADYNHLVAPAELRFHERRRVINTIPFELFQVGNVRLVVLRSGRDHDAASLESAAILQRELIRSPITVKLGRPLSHHHLSAEFFCLEYGAAGEFEAEMPVGKPM